MIQVSSDKQFYQTELGGALWSRGVVRSGYGVVAARGGPGDELAPLRGVTPAVTGKKHLREATSCSACLQFLLLQFSCTAPMSCGLQLVTP
jgi:hypothetical protein